MRLIPLPRRHRILWLIVAVLAVSAWGYWLAGTGRTPDYGSGDWGLGTAKTTSRPPSRAFVASEVAEPTMTTRTGSNPAASVSDPGSIASIAAPSSPLVPSDPVAAGAAVTSSVGLAGMTDPAAFVRSIAQLLLAYGPGTDFTSSSNTVMAVAALQPLGSPTELTSDLSALTPKPGAARAGRTVTFTPNTVEPSMWATAQFERLGLPEGAFAIDVNGTQTIISSGEQPLPVSVTLGITGACPPALTQCEIDRIFPTTVQQALQP